MNKIGIIGTGIFGTALALTAARAGNNVLCYARHDDVVDEINSRHLNSHYLPDVFLPETIQATSDIAEVLSFADVVLLAVSAQATRSVMKQIRPLIKKDTVIVLCAKGLELNSGKLLSEIAQEELPQTTIAILSGPGFATDIARNKLVSLTIACEKQGIAAQLAQMLGTASFRPYLTSDIISPQIGGSVKNVIAIASGVVEGAQFGDGARAALITRGFNEMARLAKVLGGDFRTMMGMCGLGDLVMTASCTQSRNFSFGYDIGRCGSAEKPMAENTKTVEGIYTAQAVMKRAQTLGIEMPICETINHILFDGLKLKPAMETLMSRPYKEEGI